MNHKKNVLRYFESKLALLLSDQHFTPVLKITNNILEIMDKRSEHIKEVLCGKEFSFFCEQLYGPSLGSIQNTHQPPITVDNALVDLRKSLENSTELVTTMSLHGTFAFRILRLLELNKFKTLEKSTPLQNIIQDKKRSVTPRTSDDEIEPIIELGLSCLSEEFQKNIDDLPQVKSLQKKLKTLSHKNSTQRYIVDESQYHYLPINAPLVAGPSTHTVTAIVALKLFNELYPQNNLNPEEMYLYTMAYFSYLGVNGYHSFHEVALVAKQTLSLPYEINHADDFESYIKNIPAEISQQNYFKDLVAECKALLSKLD